MFSDLYRLGIRMDKKDFDKIFSSLKDKVFRFAKTFFYNSSEAEDITQDIFEKLWVNKDKISEYKNIEAYLFRSTKNLCLDRIKHQNVVQKNASDLKYLNNNMHYPDKDTKEVSEIIKDIIKKLPHKQRMIMHLRDVEGYEFDEISETIGIELNAIRVNLSRARKSVKQELLKTMNYGL